MLGILGVASNETPGAKAEAPLDSYRPPPTHNSLGSQQDMGSYQGSRRAACSQGNLTVCCKLQQRSLDSERAEILKGKPILKLSLKMAESIL